MSWNLLTDNSLNCHDYNGPLFFQIECIQMSAREATTMGDILAAEANILGMIKEVNSILKCILLKIIFEKKHQKTILRLQLWFFFLQKLTM